ncbi:helix-turn-helix domain-containing protein [Arcanobacterium canis]
MENTQQCYTKQNAATYLGVSTRTIERLINTGQLPYLKIGRAVRIPLPNIHAYMRQQIETPNMSERARTQAIALAVTPATVTTEKNAA